MGDSEEEIDDKIDKNEKPGDTGIIEDDSDEDVTPTENVITEKEEKSVKDVSSIGLPMTQASDAWMDDVGDGGGFDDSEEEIDDNIDKNEKPKDTEIIEKPHSENEACPVDEEEIV